MALPKNTPTVISLDLTDFLKDALVEWKDLDLAEYESDFDCLKADFKESFPNPCYIRSDIVIEYLKQASQRNVGWRRVQKNLNNQFVSLPKNTPTTISLVLSEFLSCPFDEWDEHDLDEWKEDFDTLYWEIGDNFPNPHYIRKDIVFEYLKQSSRLGQAQENIEDYLKKSCKVPKQSKRNNNNNSG